MGRLCADHADHNVSRLLTDLLQQRGHDVATTRGLGLDRASDATLLLAATTMDRGVITRNERGFVLLHDAWTRWTAAWRIGRRHSGIIVMPQDQHWAPERAAVEIESVFGAASDSGSGVLIDRLRLWRTNRGWIDVPPFSSVTAGL